MYDKRIVKLLCRDKRFYPRIFTYYKQKWQNEWRIDWILDTKTGSKKCWLTLTVSSKAFKKTELNWMLGYWITTYISANQQYKNRNDLLTKEEHICPFLKM